MMQFCYPPACAACDGVAVGRRFLCPACDGRLAQLRAAGACDRCAMPLAEDGAPCPWCEGEGLRPYDRVARLATLSDPLKHLVHRIKYQGRWPVAEHLADELLECRRVRSMLERTDVLLPVPLHARRQIDRGFNQADVIATRLARRCGVPGVRVVRPVVRLRPTETQTHLHGRSRRAENLKHAFGLVRPQDVAGRRVTVVDDVLTTGATLQSLARTLKPAKPLSLCAITLAIADPERRDFEVV